MRKLSLISTLAIAGSAWAGIKTTNPVAVDTTLRRASGSVGSARNSADSTQRIGCRVETYPGSWVVLCEAVTAAGVYGTCTNGADAALRDAARSIKGDSYLVFDWDTGGTCTRIVVENASHFEPKR